MRLLSPKMFDANFKEINLRESTYPDYCNYLVLYAQTYGCEDNSRRWVKFRELPSKLIPEINDRFAEASELLQKEIQEFYGIDCKGEKL